MKIMRLSIVGAVAIALSMVAATVAEEESSGGAAAYGRNLEFVGGRAVQLAEAVPAEAYGWRPMEGVRSVSEAVMHMASANYFFAGQMGVAPPEGLEVQGMEAITDKAECVKALEASNAQLAKAFAGITDTEEAMEIFGRPGTMEDMMLIAIGHVHEHFGQLIAYARANEIAPPWSGGEG